MHDRKQVQHQRLEELAPIFQGANARVVVEPVRHLKFSVVGVAITTVERPAGAVLTAHRRGCALALGEAA